MKDSRSESTASFVVYVIGVVCLFGVICFEWFYSIQYERGDDRFVDVDNFVGGQMDDTGAHLQLTFVPRATIIQPRSTRSFNERRVLTG